MFAFAWIGPLSPTPEWDLAQVRRLTRRLGYELYRPDHPSVLGLAEGRPPRERHAGRRALHVGYCQHAIEGYDVHMCRRGQ
ncbi:hypothetical protein [Nocardia farcinica]|uniref:hypothetical protein n=1 Tax=Nocardia farcinica TaxID=37329 RepID=UPI0037BCA2BD